MALVLARQIEEIFVGPPFEIARLDKLFLPAISRSLLFACIGARWQEKCKLGQLPEALNIRLSKKLLVFQKLGTV